MREESVANRTLRRAGRFTLCIAQGSEDGGFIESADLAARGLNGGLKASRQRHAPLLEKVRDTFREGRFRQMIGRMPCDQPQRVIHAAIEQRCGAQGLRLSRFECSGRLERGNLAEDVTAGWGAAATQK